MQLPPQIATPASFAIAESARDQLRLAVVLQIAAGEDRRRASRPLLDRVGQRRLQPRIGDAEHRHIHRLRHLGQRRIGPSARRSPDSSG